MTKLTPYQKRLLERMAAGSTVMRFEPGDSATLGFPPYIDNQPVRRASLDRLVALSLVDRKWMYPVRQDAHYTINRRGRNALNGGHLPS